MIDIFPYRILHPDKYDQVSIFYRKLLDREIRKKEFLYQEQKFIYFIKGLWLYNPVNISYDLHNKRYFQKGLSKRFFKDVKKRDILLDVSNFRIVQAVLHLALREAGILWMDFKEWEVLARVCDFNIELIVRDEAILQKITPLLAPCSLYVLNRINGGPL